MIYKAEIWHYGGVIDSRESDNVEDIKQWFRSQWCASYENGMCYLEVYRENEQLSWDEKFDLGIID